MSDRELEAIKQRKLRELQRKMVLKEQKGEEVDALQVLNRIFRGRAWEVFNAATLQFPDAMGKIKDALAKLVLEGKLNEMSGEQLYALLRSVGLPVTLKTEIKFLGHGKIKSLAEKLRES